VNLAALVLLAFVFALVAFDAVQLRGKNKRALLFEVLAMLVGAFFIVFPNRATELAHLVGIGRGVDFLLYPIVIWLVRESLLSRRRRLEDAERITQLTRALAIVTTQDHSIAGRPAHAAAPSASSTT
jgi:hypothetical protein